jgi:potassium-dependent mechanosensitive channel
MVGYRRLSWVLMLSLLWISGAAQTLKPTPPFSVLVAQWTRVLDEADRIAQTPGVSTNQIEEQRRLLGEVRTEAQNARQAAETRIKAIEPLLQALGSPPDEEQPPEPEDVAAQRRQYANDLSDYRARMAMAELIVARATAMERTLQALGRHQLLEFLQERGPAPLEPATLKAGLEELPPYLLAVARIPVDWFWELPPTDRIFVLWYSGITVTFGVLVGWALRRFLLRRFGCNPAQADPSFRRRLGAAIAEGIANGVIPAFILGALLSWVGLPANLLTEPVTRAYVALGAVLIFFVLCVALTYAVLNPGLAAWRLFPLPSRAARAISRRIVLLAGLLSLDWFLRSATTDVQPSPALLAVYGLLLHSGEALLLFALTRGWLWRREDAAGAVDLPPSAAYRVFAVARWLTAVLTLLVVAALLWGYGNFGGYLIHALLVTSLVTGMLFLLHGLLLELLDVFYAPETAADPHPGRRILRFWVNFLLTGTLWVIGIILVAPEWGIPLADLWAWNRWVLDGITIGNFTLSPPEIGAAILVFAAAIIVNRLVRRLLRESILPQTRLSSGAQYSIAAGVSYLGAFVAVLLGIAALGINLENVALVAGALSVGIGFGLRNIVNSLLSGMILLAERPVKVGDWVIIGDKEGIVRHINMRSIELETFQRAAVIVPNADMIAYPIINMTHRNTVGRIEIAVGVAYGSDTAKVRELLLKCARLHLKVLHEPEPFVLFQQFGPSRLEFELRCFTGDVMERLVIASDLRHAIERQFQEEGIVIPFPQQVVHLRKNREKPRNEDPNSRHRVIERSPEPGNAHDENTFTIVGGEPAVDQRGRSR